MASQPPTPMTTTTTTLTLTKTAEANTTPYPPCIFKTAEEQHLYRRLKTIYERHSATWDQDARDAWPSIVKRASLKASTVKKVMSHTLARTLTDENLTWAHVVVLRVIFKSKLFTSQKMLKIIRRKYPAANFNTFSYREDYKPHAPDKPGSATAEPADEDMDDAPTKETTAVEEGVATPKARRAAAAAAAARSRNMTTVRDSAEKTELPMEEQSTERRIVEGEDQDGRDRERVADPAGSFKAARNDGQRRTRASIRRGEMATIKRANTRSQRSETKKNAQVGRDSTVPAILDGQETTQSAPNDASTMTTRDSEGKQQRPRARTSPEPLATGGSARPQPRHVAGEPGRIDSEIKQEVTERSPSSCPLNRPSTPEHKPVIIPNETYAWTVTRTVEPQHHNPFHAAPISSEDDHYPPLHAPLRYFGGREQSRFVRNGRYGFEARPAATAAANANANGPTHSPAASAAAAAADSLAIPLSDFFLAKAKETEAFCRAFRAAEEKKRRLTSFSTPRGGHEVALTSQTMRLDETLKRMAKKLADQDHALARITSTMTHERALRIALQERLESLERTVGRA
ncbi:hypothetical protein ESCO_002430 [Escovopsis weberi]|uniref:Uncharacterized protein n=1 Tax=Escovopsis weberi TaxID=150374 RepID=A0A0N0RT69_ESCWE|nr:hypothetical protein ESCO_002430 [Escovopsis weberi]